VKRERVSSSVIASVGYDDDTLTLEVEFHSGAVYRYFDIPNLVHTEFLAADSLGGYFTRHIRDEYPYERILDA